MPKKISPLEEHALTEGRRFKDGHRRLLESEIQKRWALNRRNMRRFRLTGKVKAYPWTNRTFGYHPNDVLTSEAKAMGLRGDKNIQRYIEEETLPLLQGKPLWTDDDVFKAFGWDQLPVQTAKHLIAHARTNGLKSIRFSKRHYRYRECDVLAYDFQITTAATKYQDERAA